jgi:hypothetical protein
MTNYGPLEKYINKSDIINIYIFLHLFSFKTPILLYFVYLSFFP